MEKKVAYIGIDCHLNSPSVAVELDGSKKIYETILLKNYDKIIARYMKKLSKTFRFLHILNTPAL